VKKGQVLFQISPTSDIQSRLTNAEIDLREAESNYLGNNNLLKNLELEIQYISEQLNLDSINFKRQERLYDQNIGTKLQYDQTRLKYFTTQKKLNILKKKLAQTSSNLKSNYKKALINTKTEKSQLDDFTIRSEIDGKIYAINKEVGDFISNQERFAELGSAESYKIEMDIDEVDITKIKVGDTVIISLDAYLDDVFVATVNHILPKKNDVTQTFRVESVFRNPPPKIYNGLSGEANIIVSKRKNALVIPTVYLMPNNKVSTSDGVKTIKIGLKNLKFVEVLSGIDANTTLLKPTN
jgi:multidrug resistance efflux pump